MLYERAQKVLPGGVTAAARANPALGHPFYVSRAEGAYLYDDHGKRFVETCMSNGATLLGHAHPAVAAAVKQAAELGLACAYDGEAQVRLAERLVEQVPSFEMVRFTTTGTEATGYAVRIARAFTGRAKVMKFEGHFHGFNDALAYNFPAFAGNPMGTGGRTAGDGDGGGASASIAPKPESLGLGETAIVVAPFNDLEATRRLLNDDLAAVVIEPIAYDMGAVGPAPGFLEMLREESTRRGIVLVFDEVLSGYRTGPDCAQGHLGVTPDLTVLGKAIGGGTPLSVVGGRRKVMSIVAPLGPAVHTGTYNAHLVPILAAHAFLDVIEEPGFWEKLLGLHHRLYGGLDAAFRAARLPVRVQGIGARCGLYFGLDPDTPVTTYRQAARMDSRLLRDFAREMHARGMYVNPAWHHGISAMHTEADVDVICEAAESAARAVAIELVRL